MLKTNNINASVLLKTLCFLEQDSWLKSTAQGFGDKINSNKYQFNILLYDYI